MPPPPPKCRHQDEIRIDVTRRLLRRSLPRDPCGRIRPPLLSLDRLLRPSSSFRAETDNADDGAPASPRRRAPAPRPPRRRRRRHGAPSRVHIRHDQHNPVRCQHKETLRVDQVRVRLRRVRQERRVCLLLQQHRARDRRGLRGQPPEGVAPGKIAGDGDEEGGPDGRGR
jgi:hypothetical protein